MKLLNNKKGFSLSELSVVILCVSIIIKMISDIPKITDSIKIFDTKIKLLRINKALEEYIIKYNSLPCPSNIILKKGDGNFGKEQFSNTENNGKKCNSVQSIFGRSNVILGGVPTQALKLSPETAIDAWGNKIIYSIDHRLVEEYRDIGTNICIAFVGKNNTYSKINNIYYALISTGPNMFNALPATNSKTINIDSSNHKAEITNTFSAIRFLSGSGNCLHGIAQSSKTFDDIVYFGTYNKLLKNRINKEY